MPLRQLCARKSRRPSLKSQKELSPLEGAAGFYQGYSISREGVKCVKANMAGALFTTEEEVNPGDYCQIIICYYKRTSIFELDIAISREKNVYDYIRNNKTFIKCEDSHLANFLLRKLKNIFGGRRGSCAKDSKALWRRPDSRSSRLQISSDLEKYK